MCLLQRISFVHLSVSLSAAKFETNLLHVSCKLNSCTSTHNASIFCVIIPIFSLCFFFNLLQSLSFCPTHHYNPAGLTITVGASITSPTDLFTAGQSYTLTCIANVTGGEILSTTTTITWIHPSGSVTSGTGSSLVLSLNPLQVSDAGQYTCNVSVSSPFFSRARNSTDTYTISVQGRL